ncbi:hypothetical protein BKA62DRAFT_660338 [Auriculariales sp. MPI-PUGE-AT-0066]|nr:hypothetical protein BKA62DRAFT_660338 [Auriculariales sp. MPI-PUGE-AT-0066]
MRSALSFVFLATAAVADVVTNGPVPGKNANPTDTSLPRLTGKRFPFDQLPFQADTVPATPDNPNFRGAQTGYNNCTGRPTADDALCQTIVVNSVADFCFFAPPSLMEVGNAEHETVAYCTQPTHGARLVPAGTFTAVQFIRSKSYVEITGFLDQTKVNIPKGDYGGELDSGAQDLRGNPIGGLAYSNALPFTPGKETQSTMWHQFIGGNMICMKLCDDKSADPRGLCRHDLDTLGCNTNVPAAYKDGVFESCESDDQAAVAEGVTGIPVSSACTPYQSAQIFGGGVVPPVPTGTATVVSTSTTAAASTTPTVSGSASKSTSGTVKPSTSATTSGGAAGPSQSAGGSASSIGASAFGAPLPASSLSPSRRRAKPAHCILHCCASDFVVVVCVFWIRLLDTP